MLTFAPKFVIVLLLTTLVLFLFPADSGSFTATHGPTTALQSLKSLHNIFAAIAAWTAVLTTLLSAGRRTEHEPESEFSRTVAPVAPLRC